jgi:uncharacterized delta-60 repeat protein
MARILFFDQSVQDFQLLHSQLAPDDHHFVVHGDDNGLAQIASIAAQFSNLSAIHIVSHGKSGTMRLGDTLLDEASLREHKSALAQIGNALACDGELLIYGCEVGKGKSGRDFVDTLADLTGVNVAASQTMTGPERLGGDSRLDYQVGTISAPTLSFAEFTSNLPVSPGRVRSDIGSRKGDERINDIAIQADGSIVAVGVAGTKSFVQRYTSDGQIDYAYKPAILNTSPDLGATGVFLQADGKAIIVGLTGAQGYVERRNLDGTLDSSFGTSGRFLTNFAGSGDKPTDVTIQADGKIVLIGAGSSGDFAIQRLNANGTIDNGFGASGTLLTNVNLTDGATGVIVQADGKIVVGGSCFLPPSGTPDFNIVRYTSAGALDTSFDSDGKASTTFGASDFATALAVQADGKYVQVGYTDINAATTGPNDFAVVRWNADGTLDTSFDSDGRLTIDFTSDDRANAVAIQSDGKIIVAGSWDGGASDFAIVRLNTNGTLDTSFSSDGKANFTFGTGTFGAAEFAYTLKIQADGKIVVAGQSNSAGSGIGDNDIAMLRIDTNGSLDTSFGTAGKVKADVSLAATNEVAREVLVQADGKIIAVGESNGVGGLFRYNSNGTFDQSFGDGGKQVGTGSVVPSVAAALQGDGKIVTLGTSFGLLADASFQISRYTTAGALDTSFGINGGTSISFGAGTLNVASDLIMQSDGKIVAVGRSGGDSAIVRLTSAGQLDASFGTGGKVITDQSNIDDATSVIVQADGKIVVGGSNFLGNSANFSLARYTTSGVLDTSFSSDGRADATFGLEDIATSLALQSDGKYVQVGYTNVNNATTGPNDFAVARWNADGTLDTSFDVDGLVTIDFANDDRANSVAIQSDGKVIVAGSWDGGASDFAIVRLNTNGSLDTSFSGDGKANFSFANSGFGNAEFAYSVKIQADGKIVVAGSTNTGTTSNDSDIAIIRINSDGTLDTSFLGDGDTINGTSGADNLAGTISTDLMRGADGDDTLQGGLGPDTLDGGRGFDFASYLGAASSVVARLDINGGNTGEALGDVISNTEGLIGSNFGDTLIGNANANYIAGVDGADFLYGLGGVDSLLGAAGSDTLEGGLGADVIDGGSDFDFASYINAATAVTARLDIAGGNSGEALGDTYTAVEGIIGSGFEDFLLGQAGSNYLSGQGGADYLAGLAGSDTLLGDEGSDTLDGGVGADSLVGGNGLDFATYQNATAGLTARLDFASLNSGDGAGDSYSSVEGLIGSGFNDFLVGNTAGNYLTSIGGDDYLAGVEGNDTLIGGDGADQIWGGIGADIIDGGAGYDIARYDFAATGVVARLDGGAGSGEATGDTYVGIEALYGSAFGDFLIGDSGANVLVGLDGGDLLYGLGGDDILLGGGGIDAFAFNTAGFGADTVLDFATTAAAGANHDFIDFRGIGALSTFAITQSGADALITTNLGTVRLQGITSSTLVAGDFLF